MKKPEGTGYEVSMGVVDLQVDLEFYTKLGFTRFDGGDKVYGDEGSYPWAALTDGRVSLGLHQEGNAIINSLPYLTYFAEDLSGFYEALESAGVKFEKTQRGENDILDYFLIMSPDGVGVNYHRIKVESSHSGADKPSTATCGTFGELAIHIKAIEASKRFWTAVGFELVHEDTTPWNWCLMKDNLITLGLHAANDFTEAGLTYFDDDIKSRVHELEAKGLTIEKGEDFKMRSPSGQQIFLFQNE